MGLVKEGDRVRVSAIFLARGPSRRYGFQSRRKKNGITAFQMDIKSRGFRLKYLKKPFSKRRREGSTNFTNGRCDFGAARRLEPRPTSINDNQDSCRHDRSSHRSGRQEHQKHRRTRVLKLILRMMARSSSRQNQKRQVKKQRHDRTDHRNTGSW